MINKYLTHGEFLDRMLGDSITKDDCFARISEMMHELEVMAELRQINESLEEQVFSLEKSEADYRDRIRDLERGLGAAQQSLLDASDTIEALETELREHA